MINELNDNRQPLSAVIRRRRTALHLSQEQIANALEVTPEAVCGWERQTRRIELDRVPHLAAVLSLDEHDVCSLALFEHSPRLHAALFGTERPPAPRPLDQQ